MTNPANQEKVLLSRLGEKLPGRLTTLVFADKVEVTDGKPTIIPGEFLGFGVLLDHCGIEVYGLHEQIEKVL